MKYLDTDNIDGGGKTAITELFKPDFKVMEGNNRHEAILRVMESLIVRNASILPLEEIKHLARRRNNELCKPPLDDKEFEKQWNCAIKFVSKSSSSKGETENGDPRREEQKEDQTEVNGIEKGQFRDKKHSSESEEDSRLASEEELTSEDIAFVIDTMKKEAPYDKISIKQLFYGMDSVFTKCPIPHTVNSKDAGAGKSYLLSLVAGYFPDKYVIVFSGMSDKAIFHRPGVMVIENKETGEVEEVEPIINNLELESEELQERIEEQKKTGNNKVLINENKRRIKEIQYEIKDIRNHGEKLIDLNNQIILCLDTPQDSLFDTLMSLTSQDTPRDQKYTFAEKSTSGQMGTRVNRIRGMPVLFTSRVIDDTRTHRFQEKNRRFINVTPETSNKKIRTANELIGKRYGCLPEEYDMLVVSRQHKEKAKSIVKILVAKLKEHSKHLGAKESGIKIPFEKAVTRSIPANNNQPWSMTVTERTMKYLAIITKVNLDSRPKIVSEETGEFYPISTFEDLKEALLLMERAASGIRPYITKWFNCVFVPAIKDLNGKPNKLRNGDGVLIDQEKYVGVTTEQLAEKTKDVFDGPRPSNEELRYKYLYPLINQGIIDKVQSVTDGRQNLFLPVEETTDQGNIFSLFEDPDDPRLKVSNPCIYPSKHVIEESFRFLLEYDVKSGVGNNNKYRLIDIDGKEITVDQLIDKYFGSPESCFVKDWYPSEEQAAITKNILYSSQIIQQKIIPPTLRHNLCEFPNKAIEDTCLSNRDTAVDKLEEIREVIFWQRFNELESSGSQIISVD